MQRRRPVMLVVLDGWGWRDDVADNAIRQARTPTFDRLWAGCPHAFLHTSGPDVGLPSGQMGNSEVGHLNIGAGRLVMQDLPRINAAVARGEIDSAPALQGLIERLRRTGGTCHLLGLVSPGGVHSHQDHAAALAGILVRANLPTVVHAFTDGRDTPPRSARDDIARLTKALPAVGPDRDGQRPLLRHGSRQALGARGQGLSRHRGGRRAALPRCRRGDRGCLWPRSQRRVRGAGGGRRLQRHSRRRRRALLQLPGRPRARDSRRHARPRVRRLCARSRRAVRGSGGHDPVQRASGRLPADDLSAGESGQRSRRGGRRSRTDAIAHGRDREISARHVFPQRRRGGALPRRGSHHGAVAEGCDLRPAARDVGARIDRQGGGGDRVRPLRPDRVELRQSRHGRAHRQPGGRGQGGRDRRCRPRAHRRGDRKSRRRFALHRRPWQLRADARSQHRRPAHLPHHQSCAGGADGRRQQPACATGGSPTSRPPCSN